MPDTTLPPLIVRELDLQPYEKVWRAMQDFVKNRKDTTPDELWVLQHYPVFTLGQAGKDEHLLRPGEIPVVHSDRGGQVTYHGPGQLIIYVLINLKRNKLGVRDLVTLLEESTINCLAGHAITASARADAPGVYVDGSKIASLGLRIRRGSSYHGLSFNFDMDLEPFSRINVCGYKGLKVTHFKSLVTSVSIEDVTAELLAQIKQKLIYSGEQRVSGWASPGEG